MCVMTLTSLVPTCWWVCLQMFQISGKRVNCKKYIDLFDLVAFVTWSTRPMFGCRARSASLWVHRNLFWQLSRDRNLHALGMSHVTTASPNHLPGHIEGWAIAMVSRRSAWWTIWKSWHPCPCQNYSQGPPAEKTGRGSLLNCPCPSCSPDDPISQGTELNIFARLGVKSHGLAAWHRVKITITRSICLTMGLT